MTELSARHFRIFQDIKTVNLLQDKTLIELLKKSDYDLRRLESIEIDESQFTSYRAGNTDPIPVIYQSGYLTIKGYDERFRIYKLGFPNDEVKYGFLNSLVPYYTSLSG